MKPLCFLFLILLVHTGAKAQKGLNIPLKRELDSLLILDQKYREALSLNMRGQNDSLALVYGVDKQYLNNYLWKLQGNIDSLNIIRIEEIIKQYGYPGASLVGKPANETAFFIIQHSKVIDKYLPVIKKATEKHELDFKLYAGMLDRSLMFKDKEQIYGTQGSGMSVKNPETGSWENLSYIWPIKNPSTVNKRRKEAGFNDTVEQNANRMGIEYKIFKIKEILKLQNEIMNENKNKPSG